MKLSDRLKHVSLLAFVVFGGCALLYACSNSSPNTTDGGPTNCGTGSTLCGQACVSTATDNANCGSCGNSCTAGQICSKGTCATSCGGGTTQCGTTCNDTQTDPHNCGSCNTTCSSGEVCSGGNCGTTCAGSQTFCGGDSGTPYCASTQTDNANCGGCGVTCGTGKVCHQGTCSNSCAAEDGGVETLCLPDSGAPYCANTQTDSLNCNACGNACPAAANATSDCVSGACSFVCSSGYADCNHVASDGCEATLAADSKNCGGCGQVCASGTCASSACVLSGATGTAWQMLAATPNTNMYNFEDYAPTWDGKVYAAPNGSATYSFNPQFDIFSAALSGMPNYAYWNSLVPDGNYLYVISAGSVAKYDIAADTWTTPLNSVVDNSYSLSAKDASRIIWSVTTESTPRIIKYDIAANTVSYIASGLTGVTNEARVAWDPTTNKLYIGPSFVGGAFYSFDIKTSTLTTLAPHPESYMNDIFCSDHSGHIYAGGDPNSTPNSTMWQYTISTAAWAQIPNLPFDKGNDGACVVSADGWLYVTNAESTNFARILLE